MPTRGLANWFSLGNLLTYLYLHLRMRLSFDGMESLEETGDGLRGVFRGGPAPVNPGGSGYEAPDTRCNVCSETVGIQKKMTFFCGRATCCGTPVIEGSSIVRTARRVVVTQNANLWDNTTGTLVISSCTRTLITESGPVATATSGCEEAPDCGSGSYSESGCSGAPQCAGAPAPGFRCYVVTSSTTAYQDSCYYADLAAAAQASAAATTETMWTTITEDDFLGASAGRGSDEYYAVSWDFRRTSGRLPIHIILELRETNYGGSGTPVYSEEIITIDAATVSGVYTLEPPGPGKVVTVTACEIVYGKLPP